MERLRRFVILLLCLTVPMAGWASVVDVEFCPARDHADAALAQHGHVHSHAHGVAQHSHRPTDNHSVASTGGETIHSADGKGNTCQHTCACGCDMGTCASGLAALSAAGHMGVGLFASRIEIPSPASVHWSAPRGSTPLRPPIS